MKKTQETAAEEKLVQETPAPKKTAARKKAAPKAAPEKTEEVFVQYGDGEWKTDELVQKAKDAYVAEGHRAANIRKLSLYVKPEERKAYYVINDKASGSVDL